MYDVKIYMLIMSHNGMASVKLNSITVDEFTEFCTGVKEPLNESDEFGSFF